MGACGFSSLHTVAAAALAFSVFAVVVDCTSRDQDGYVVDGRVKLGGSDTISRKANVKVLLNGGEKVTYIHSNGYFAILGVAPGTHLLEIVAPGYHFPPVRVDVSERRHGQVHAVYTETRRILPDPLTLEAEKVEYYYEKRAPLSPVGLLKSPMGMLVGLMLVAVVLLPKLMDSIDPEEMKRVQEEMRNQPAPSFSSLLQGRGS
eukprot:TRINITY_DN4203_c0_g1_i1.p1 TRINITY_DN4203_c0_g1~~TRINITY_DN4203_c0_g1_i1.p1  ORF type:complete len:204 (-),score=19.74 TRINITY_DN4203_c0_g1_i1:281-892(-)